MGVVLVLGMIVNLIPFVSSFTATACETKVLESCLAMTKSQLTEMDSSAARRGVT